MIQGKKILLGICCSIAAYKAAVLARLLGKHGAQVRVIMTPGACSFITPLTLSTLTNHEVITQFYNSDTAVWNNHVHLGLWADVVLIAPASASVMSRLATGLCNDVLAATYLSARCPVVLAPAMDVDMWHHPATQANIAKLKSYGNHIIPVAHGFLASGLVGDGRMAEPEEIVTYLETFFMRQQHPDIIAKLSGKKLLITAGPTYEPIDPVRFIGNRSSGKMGIALAQTATALGAQVTLVLGPTNLRPQPADNLTLITVETADQMYQAAIKLFGQTQIAILSAAVSDYTPEQVSEQKIKKTEGGLTIPLTKTADILAYCGLHKKAGQFVVGFALETNDEVSYAQKKLQIKNADLIVLNSLRDAGAGFGHDTNKISFILPNAAPIALPLLPKTAVALEILDKIADSIA